ncbi:hypothetical protein J8J14_13810 [Roseomonas sp. SSH11]|uniref:Lipoprotein n=1 Tax=Pararoseomonas baculiformis TaxID=2820812 RepID=A0ABS4AFP5_9PROT|nr:hypothetical protein [Pararoseomonas baculiformis]MBP0445851.1 hypothetical protein [Pararoseomonas baculiformis]
MRRPMHAGARGGLARALIVACAAMMLAGCDLGQQVAAGAGGAIGQVLNPTMAELQEVKALHGRGAFAAVADRSVSCEPAQEGCGQLRLLRADSCRRLGMNAGPRRREYLDCAIANYGATLVAAGQRPDPMVDRREAESGLLDASQRRRDAAGDRADAAAQNDALLRRAMAAQAGPAARPAGFYYAADATLNGVLQAGTSGGCVRIAEAERLLDQAGADGTAFGRPAQDLRRAIAAARSARGCAA